MNKKIFFIITIILLLFVVFWDRILYKHFLTLNSNFNYVAEIISLDNFYDSESNSFKGEENSISKFSYNVVEENSNYLVILNSFNVKTVYGDQIVSIDRMYAIDKISQQHVFNKGDRERTGYLFAPKNIKKGQSFQYWHVNYDAPAKMSFVKEEEIDGLKVYMFESDYSDEVIDQTFDLEHLPGVPEERGVILSPNISIWVEPVSGWLVKYTDQTDANYYDINTNEIIEPWNSFRNFYTQGSIDQQVSIAKSLKLQDQLMHYGVIIFFVLLWILFLMVFTYIQKLNSSLLIKSLIFGLLFFLIIIATLGAWWNTRLQSEEIYKISLDNAKQNIQETIVERMHVYSNALSGLNGLMYSSDTVSRSEWKSYIDSISIQTKYPGLQGFGYAQMLEKDEIDDFESKVRSEGFPEFTFNPRGERELYSAILYIEPFDERNKRAFGYDMFSESTRRQALNVADQTNNLSMSGKVTLVQEFDSGVQPGLLLYLPFYKDGELEGYVYSIFRMYDLINNMFSSESLSTLGFKIYDASKTDVISEDNLLYDFQNSGDRNFNVEVVSLGQYSMQIYNTKWIIEYFTPINSVLYASDHSVSNVILLFGSTVSLILLIFFIVLFINQDKSIKLVIRLKNNLDKEKNSIQEQNTSLSSQIDKFKLAQKISSVGYFEYDLVSDKTFWTDQQFITHNMDQKDEPIKFNNYIDIVVSDYKNKFEKSLIKLMNSKTIYRFTYPILIKPKKVTWIKFCGLSVYENQKIIKIIGTMQDVTSIEKTKKSHLQLIYYVVKQLQIPLKEKKSLIKELFASGLNNLSSSQTRLVKNLEFIVDNTLAKTKLLSNIINMEHGIYDFPMKLFHPKELLKLVVSKYNVDIKNKKLKLLVNIDDNISPLVSDVSLINDVLSIVISNAILYSKHLSEINIDVSQNIESIVFTISDHGYGIPDSEKEKIFSRYFRGSNTLKYNRFGTGLSLNYVQNVITILGGTIKINSKQDMGTTVKISIPKKLS